MRPFWASLLLLLTMTCLAQERHENFDKDPQWESHNSRSPLPERPILQNFGYSATSHTGVIAGEIGGFVTPDARPAYYAKKIPQKTLEDTLSASGTLACVGKEFNLLVGFFNTKTLNEWRTPNTLAIRLYGRGDVFYVYVEYMTKRWRAGADNPGGFSVIKNLQTGKERFRGFITQGKAHTWSLKYDPNANDGNGAITATMDGETSVCILDKGHKTDGAEFNRFGLLNVIKHCDGGGEVWIDNIAVNGEKETFAQDPHWDALNNRTRYLSKNVRPRFDYGYSPTRFAGGMSKGEMGGLVFRGDNRYVNSMAYYADRLEALALDKPFHASGKITLRRAVSDSTTLIGFFHSEDTIAVGTEGRSIPDCFVGAAIEGPSSQGFLFYPVYGVKGDARAGGYANAPFIYPDGKVHSWTLAYTPMGTSGQIVLSLNGKSTTLELSEAHRARGARFNRFGIVTTWTDGNGQVVYLDDLRYTFQQK